MKRTFAKKGITLIELLIVISLIGVFSYLGMPYFKSFVAYSNLSRDSWMILSDLRTYRELSIVEHYNYGFVFNTTKNSYTIEKRDPATNALISQVKTQTLESDITLATNTEFFPTGEATPQSTIKIIGENPKDQFQISVSAVTGLTKLTKL